MERADGSGSKGRAVSPIKAFVALMLLIAALAAYVLLRQEEPEVGAGAGARETPAFQLTNAEAVKRFEELNAIRIAAYEERDPSLIPQAFVAGTRTYSRVAREIQVLKRDGVLSKTQFKTQSLQLLENSPTRIRLEQVVIIDPRFTSEKGREVTRTDITQRQTIEWLLSRQDDAWLIEASAIIASQRVKEVN